MSIELGPGLICETFVGNRNRVVIPGIFPLPVHRFSFGIDSTVYMVGYDWVIKMYDKKGSGILATLDQIKFYAEVTNNARELDLADILGSDFKVVVNPITEVGVYEAKEALIPLSVSPYISGPTIYSDVRRLNQGDVRWLEKHQSYLRLEEANEELNNKLGVTGIDLRAVNVKVVGAQLVITDLCGEIRGLQRAASHSIKS